MLQDNNLIATDLRNALVKPERVVSVWAVLTVASAVVSGVTVGLSVALLVLAGGALLGVIGLLWSSLHNLTGQSELTLDEALHMAAPSAEEEQKRSVLRALKDLEFERSVGKISEEDYATLSATYRQQAKDLIRALDAGLEPLRAEIDAIVAAKLSEADAPPKKAKAKRKRRAERPAPKQEQPEQQPEPVQAELPSDEPLPETRTCSACQLANDADARFCKACGASLEVG
jgi:hypothetical protein